MIEGLAEVDEHLMEKYVHGEAITADELKKAVRKGTIAMTLFPVLCGASFKNKGVQALLDAVIDFLPSPLEIPAMQGINPETRETEVRKAADNEPFAALAFKIMNDQHVGQLVFLRVYSGQLPSGSAVYNSTKDKKERVGRLLRMHANKREEIAGVAAGDIAAVIGLKATTTGKPQVAYRETIRRRAEAQGKFVRQTGGRGQYGDVELEVEPAEPGEGIVFENKIVGGSIPKEYIAPVEKGVREALETGVLAGYQ